MPYNYTFETALRSGFLEQCDVPKRSSPSRLAGRGNDLLRVCSFTSLRLSVNDAACSFILYDYHAMNAVSITSGSIVMAAAIAIFVVLPPSVTINVGDRGSRVNEIGRYGYLKSIFSLRDVEDSDGNTLEPSAFLVGPDGYHLLIWHNDRIDSMTHFRNEQPAPNTYGEWHDVKQVDTFTVDRPSLTPFFAGIIILVLVGYLLSRFHRTSFVLYAILILIVPFIVFGFSTLAGTLAILPMLAGVGWLAAPILGRSLANIR